MRVPLWLRALRPGKLPFYWSLYALGVLAVHWMQGAVRILPVIGMLLAATLLYEAQVFLNDYVDREVDRILDKPTWIRVGLAAETLPWMAGLLILLALALGNLSAGGYGIGGLTGLLLLGVLYHLPCCPLKRLWPFSLMLIAALGTGAFALGLLAASGSLSGLHAVPGRWWAMLFLSFFLVLGNKDRPDVLSERRHRSASLFTLFPGAAGRRLNALLTFLGFLMPPLWLWPVPLWYAVWAGILGGTAVILALREPYREDLFWGVYFLYAVPTLWIFRMVLLRG
ncbi:MAG: UbiA family prenyltransferase [Candidatus Hydrothermae bacterium]|nr:UbiA family prenyltransferase [Candidatus Hydrothermae bacterium]